MSYDLQLHAYRSLSENFFQYEINFLKLVQKLRRDKMMTLMFSRIKCDIIYNDL